MQAQQDIRLGTGRVRMQLPVLRLARMVHGPVPEMPPGGDVRVIEGLEMPDSL